MATSWVGGGAGRGDFSATAGDGMTIPLVKLVERIV
jgi:hypothetical protein